MCSGASEGLAAVQNAARPAVPPHFRGYTESRVEFSATEFQIDDCSSSADRPTDRDQAIFPPDMLAITG